MDEFKKAPQPEEEELLADEEMIQLINDDGETVNFYHVATIEHNEKWFVAFQPAEEMEDIEEDEVAFFGLETDEKGEDVFVPVEDEELLDELFDKFMEMTEEDCCCGEEECEACKGAGGGENHG